MQNQNGNEKTRKEKKKFKTTKDNEKKHIWKARERK